MSFTKSKIMDMINKAASHARNGNEQEIESMYYALYYVACFSIERHEFAVLVSTPHQGVYREVLASVTDRTYKAFK